VSISGFWVIYMSNKLAIHRSWSQTLYGHLSLARISNSPTVVSNTLAGAALAGALRPDGRVALVALTMVLFYTAGMYLNDLLDYALDCHERPERPLPSGTISRFSALTVTIILFAFGSAVLLSLGLLPFLSGLILIVLIVCYDIWHKSNPVSPLLMACCRFMVYVTAFLSFSLQGLSSLSGVLVPGCLLLLYVVGMTYIAKTENKMSALNVGIVALLFLPTVYFMTRVSLFSLPLILCFTGWVAYSISFVYRTPQRQIGRTVGQLIAGIALLDAVILVLVGVSGKYFFYGTRSRIIHTDIVLTTLCERNITMHKTVVINAVGLTAGLLGPSTPRLCSFVEQTKQATINPVLPAVTCSVQATYLTGRLPSEHGIVGNGWYVRDECEIKFWKQSNALIQSPKLWETARQLDPTFTCANLFWWFNMYSSVDYAVTPRPMYPSDGRKLPDIYTQPADLRNALQKQLGQFPLFNFWGPNSSIASTKWIAESAKWVDQRHDPTLTLIYLPHLDYCLQRFGPVQDRIAHEVRQLDAVCSDLIDYYSAHDARVIVLSEYGITPVSRPVHLNREFRKHGLIAVRQELGREMLDAGASVAFAVADHQVAHIYVNDSARLPEVRALLEQTAGIAEVLDEEGKRKYGLNHERAGDLVVVAEPDAWFTYYYWLDDKVAPDYARTVDIHHKPGYDPVELFIDPTIKVPQAKVGWTLLKKKLGFRYLLDVIPLNASLVRGSHGRIHSAPEDAPIFLTRQRDLLEATTIDATDVYNLILRHLTSDSTV